MVVLRLCSLLENLGVWLPHQTAVQSITPFTHHGFCACDGGFFFSIFRCSIFLPLQGHTGIPHQHFDIPANLVWHLHSKCLMPKCSLAHPLTIPQIISWNVVKTFINFFICIYIYTLYVCVCVCFTSQLSSSKMCYCDRPNKDLKINNKYTLFVTFSTWQHVFCKTTSESVL